MTFVITTKGIDLSIGSTLAITNALCAILLQNEINWIVVLISLCLLGLCIGGVQGYFIAFEKIPAIKDVVVVLPCEPATTIFLVKETM